MKGFIDARKNIYELSVDTKVISKVIEWMILPLIYEIAQKHQFEIEISEHQNYYPDVTVVIDHNKKYAIDFKSSYRVDAHRINGLTLGAFTGYFRDRTSLKNTAYPYGDYEQHYVLGAIYSRADVWEIMQVLEWRGYQINNRMQKLAAKFVSSPDEANLNNLLAGVQKQTEASFSELSTDSPPYTNPKAEKKWRERGVRAARFYKRLRTWAGAYLRLKRWLTSPIRA